MGQGAPFSSLWPLLKKRRKAGFGAGGGYLKPKVWGAEAVSGWEEE